MAYHEIETDLIGLAKDYLGRWVALNPEDQSRVIASGDTAKEVYDRSREQGIDCPVVLWVADDYGSLAP